MTITIYNFPGGLFLLLHNKEADENGEVIFFMIVHVTYNKSNDIALILGYSIFFNVDRASGI